MSHVLFVLYIHRNNVKTIAFEFIELETAQLHATISVSIQVQLKIVRFKHLTQ